VRGGNPPSLTWCGFDVLSPALLYELLRFRQAIFVVEQNCAYPDLDGRDQGAQHLLLRIDGALAGCLRLIAVVEERRVKIGRVAVAEASRGQGIARQMMEEALARCRHDYPDYAVTLSGQTYLARFYESLGFCVTSAPYDDFGIPHVDMALHTTDADHPGTAKGRARDP
jgi:ElaA protein